MNVNMVFIETDSYLSCYGVKSLINEIYSHHCIIYPEVESRGGLTIKDAMIRKLGNHSFNLLSSRVCMEMVTYTPDMSLNIMSDSLKNHLDNTHLKRNETSDIFYALSEMQKNIISKKISGRSDYEIIHSLDIDSGTMRKEVESLKMRFGLARGEGFIHLFRRSLTVIISDRLL